ncbi:MAG: hypothetical protein MUC57_15675, partial [Desulfobacterales bacterium]|nr:hypothetical protein [Desulfobacterales bacterium]
RLFLLSTVTVLSKFGPASLVLPDSGLHHTLNQGLASHMVGHEFFHVILKALSAKAPSPIIAVYDPIKSTMNPFWFRAN